MSRGRRQPEGPATPRVAGMVEETRREPRVAARVVQTPPFDQVSTTPPVGPRSFRGGVFFVGPGDKARGDSNEEDHRPGPRGAGNLRLATAVAASVATLVVAPVMAQNTGERWVATWATALVARGLPAGRGTGAPPAASGVAAPPAAATAPATPPAAAPPAPGPGRAGGPPPVTREQPDAAADRAHQRRRQPRPGRVEQCIRHGAGQRRCGRHRAARR